MTYHRVCYKINRTGSTSEAGTVYPSYSLMGLVLLNLNICLCSCYVDHWLSFCPYWPSWSWLHYLGNIKFNLINLISVDKLPTGWMQQSNILQVEVQSDMLKTHIFRSFWGFRSYIVFSSFIYCVSLFVCIDKNDGSSTFVHLNM